MPSGRQTLTLIALTASIAGCATVPRSSELSLDVASKYRHAYVVLSAPGSSSMSGGARSDPGGDPLAAYPAPGITPALAASPAGIVGGAIAMGLIGALVGADARAHRQESLQLLARDGKIPDQDFASAVAQREFGALAAKPTPMRILDVARAEAESAGSTRRHGEEQSAALLRVSIRQTMSVDLSRLRIHLHARLFSERGTELMEQNIFYLPISIPGVTNEQALKNWAVNDYRLYREQVAIGVAGAVDALDAVVFSRVESRSASFPDAQALLKRTSCFGGDYDAGIPMSAYQGGRILPTRSAVTAIKLENGDILVFPRCEA